MRWAITLVLASILIPANVTANENAGLDRNVIRSHAKACKGWYKTLKRIHPTTEQKEEIVPLLDDYIENTAQTAEDRAAARVELFKTVYSPDIEFDEDQVRSDFQALSDLREEVVVLHAQLAEDLEDILDARQYRVLIRSRAQLYHCSLGPSKLYRRVIRRWKNN